MQLEGMLYQQIVGIPMGTNCASLIADLFLFCYERDFMSNLHKSKWCDLIDMFNVTSQYLDDIYSSQKVTHNILVYGKVQIIVAITSVLNISNEVEYEDNQFEGFW